MPGGRRKWAPATQGSSFRLQWVDKESGVFKVEQENDGLTDAHMEEWGTWMDSQIERQFRNSDHPPLTAHTLNFSRNEFGDEGVRAVVEYLRRREIGVQMVKFFKNKIGDGGAWAIGQLLAHSREPVHEVHLSHNRITEKGACSIFEAIARSHRYPFSMDRSGRRGVNGYTPVWLRMEYNCIEWGTIEHRFDQQQIRWCVAESRDGWGPKASSPMVCMHSSYKNQKSDENSHAPASPLHEDYEDNASRSPRESAGMDNVPMYVFLDATALRRFATPRDRAKERLFTFQGLLNLCIGGHMKIAPINDPPHAKGRAEEAERVIFVVTDSVLDELASISEYSQSERQQVEWLRSSQDSYLTKCHKYGILEVLETRCHQELVRVGKYEYRAAELGISRLALQNLDFACLWESQISIPGRVLVVTADEAMCTLTSEMGRDSADLRRVVTTHIHHLDRTFASDWIHGGNRLYEVSQKPGPCSAVLSAQVMHALIVEPILNQKPIVSAAAAFLNAGSAGHDMGDEDGVRQALREAINLVADFSKFVEGSRASAGEVHRFLERTNAAQGRWQGMLDWRPLPVCQ
mmetsp:Transcript_42003/g.90215  ORF Transcript_42003/g.90215 Transcript_42003/m.90215 type:complete len:576 (+) Transcript_42003:318-2045(+)